MKHGADGEAGPESDRTEQEACPPDVRGSGTGARARCRPPRSRAYHRPFPRSRKGGSTAPLRPTTATDRPPLRL